MEDESERKFELIIYCSAEFIAEFEKAVEEEMKRYISQYNSSCVKENKIKSKKKNKRHG